jgi:hypothetical protein
MPSTCMGRCVNELEGRGEKRRGGVDDGDGGRLQEYVVDADSAPDINSRQKRKLAWRPHMMVLYAAHLKRVFAAAGTPLAAVHVTSCSVLNSRPAQQLYIPSANLLDYDGTLPPHPLRVSLERGELTEGGGRGTGQYERLGVSLVARLLYPL